MRGASVLDEASWDVGEGELTLFDLRSGPYPLVDSEPDWADLRSPGRAEARSAVDIGDEAQSKWPGGEPTLDDLIVSAWEGLAARAPSGIGPPPGSHGITPGTVECPICGGVMEPANPDGRALRVAGLCRECGTGLD